MTLKGKCDFDILYPIFYRRTYFLHIESTRKNNQRVIGRRT